MPRHIITLLIVTGAFFGLLWMGVVVFNQTPGTAMLLSFITLLLIGLGVTYSVSTLRQDRTERD